VAAFRAAIQRWRMHIMPGGAQPFGDKAPNPAALIGPVDQNNAHHVALPYFEKKLSPKSWAWKDNRIRAGRTRKAG
jgi:hypothetical protein